MAIDVGALPLDPPTLSTGRKRRRLDGEELALDATHAVPGDSIALASEWMRGHGTYLETPSETDDSTAMAGPTSGQVLASVAGTVVRVNKLIGVHPLRSRYRPEVGDLVLARVVDVGPRRWKCDARARLDAVLMLSSIHLPGGVQRRKLESDELQMRAFFTEGDLLVAEVQNFSGDGAMSLHTRSLKYGKLRNGVLVTVPPALVVRLKSHFRSLPCGVDLILGLNGMIWVSATPADAGKSSTSAGDANVAAPIDAEPVASALYSSVNDPISRSQRGAVARVAACVRALAHAGAPVSDASIAAAYDASLPDDGAFVADGEEARWRVVDLAPGSAGAYFVVAAAMASLEG